MFTLEDRVGNNEKSLKDCYQDVSDRGRGGLEGGHGGKKEKYVILLTTKKYLKKDISDTVKKHWSNMDNTDISAK